MCEFRCRLRCVPSIIQLLAYFVLYNKIFRTDGTNEPFCLDKLIRHLCPGLHVTDEWRKADGYETSCIDCWRPIKAYIKEHGSITKRGIKATIKATTTR